MKEVISTEKSLHHTHITNLINKYDIELNVNQIKISLLKRCARIEILHRNSYNIVPIIDH